MNTASSYLPRRPLNIIQVVNVRWFNATAWYALFLSRILKEAGHNVMVLGLENTASFAKAQEWQLDPIALPLNTVNPLKLAGLTSDLSKLLQSFKPDVVNCHRGENFILWSMLRSRFPFALVRTRGDQRKPKTGLGNALIHNKFSDGLIATNSAVAHNFSHLFHSPENRISTICGGVDSRMFQFSAEGREKVRKEFHIAPDDFLLGLVGRLDPVKGILETITALSEAKNHGLLANHNQRIKLMFIGFPANISKEEVMAHARKHNLAEETIITGKRADVPDCISALDMAIIASQGSEAIARAAFEIMSCGIPLVGTRVGVLPDLLPDQGLVFPHDPQALREIIAKGINDSEWRNTLRQQELHSIVEFSEQDFLQQILAAYERAIIHRGRS